MIVVSAAAINLSMAAINVALSRAPGWRIGRLLGAIALTAGLFNIVSIVFCTAGFAPGVYLAAGRLEYLLGTLGVVLWVVYAYADSSGSLQKAPKGIRRLAIAVAAVAVAATIGGGLLKPQVGVLRVAWAGVTYRYPMTTVAGDIYGLVLAGLLALAFVRLMVRFRNGERQFGLQIVFFGVFYLCAVDEVLVANRMLNFLFLADIGFVLVVMPLSWQAVRRISRDARRLQDLSSHLEQEVALRAEERDHARHALVANEQNVRNLVASLDAVLWEGDPETLKLNFVSEGARRLLGYPVEEWLEGKAFWARYVHPDDRERTITEATRAMRSGEAVAIEYRMLAADGSIRWLRDIIHPVAPANGFPARIRGIIVDITESRHAHEALRESEERYRSLFENVTLGLYRTTPEGRLLMANPAYVRLLRYESFAEMAAIDLEKGDFAPFYPRSSFRRAIESRDVVTGFETECLRRDGTTVCVRESARAVRAADGTVLYYDGIVEDVTERKQFEEALRKSEERYRNVVEQQTELISRLTPDGAFTFVNEAYYRFFGRTAEELLGTKWHPLAAPEDVPLVESMIRTLSPADPGPCRREPGAFGWRASALDAVREPGCFRRRGQAGRNSIGRAQHYRPEAGGTGTARK